LHPVHFNRVVGHRGHSRLFPENTLVSARAAIAQGVKWVECDVHLSKDGIPFVIHDAILSRVTGGRHIGKVSDYTAAELKKMDVGSWKGARFAGEQIPTLAEMLEVTKGKATLIIEMKDEGMEKAVEDTIKRSGVSTDEVEIFDWSTAPLDRIKQLDSRLATTLLVEDFPTGFDERAAIIADAKRAGATRLGLENRNLDPGVFRQAEAAGLEVSVWTVNKPEDMARLTAWGAKRIISDLPDLAQQVVEEVVNKRGL
jgi:glycerophosphoryl diester phosphodiesterase